MKHIKTFAVLSALTATSTAFMAEPMDGMDMKPVGHAKQSPKLVAAGIRKIHLGTGKATLKYGAIGNFGIGAITMTSAMKDKTSLKNFREGQSVLAVFNMVDGQPTVVDPRSKQAIGGVRPIGYVPSQGMAVISRTGFSP